MLSHYTTRIHLVGDPKEQLGRIWLKYGAARLDNSYIDIDEIKHVEEEFAPMEERVNLISSVRSSLKLDRSS